MRKIVAVIAGVVLLGCAGVAEQIGELAGVEVSAKTGDEAVHPADFPLPPPDEGELAQSMEMSMASMTTRTVQYHLPEGADRAAVLDKYEAVLRGMSDEIVRDDTQVSVQLEGNGMITAQLTAVDGKSMLSLVEVQAGGGAPAGTASEGAPEAPAGEAPAGEAAEDADGGVGADDTE